jgi:hypothetical protein
MIALAKYHLQGVMIPDITIPRRHERCQTLDPPIGDVDMAYQNFSLLLADGDFAFRVEIVAVSLDAAKADIHAAYGDVRLVQWGVR